MFSEGQTFTRWLWLYYKLKYKKLLHEYMIFFKLKCFKIKKWHTEQELKISEKYRKNILKYRNTNICSSRYH